MLDGVGRFAMHRFAMQVKGGEYRQDAAGQWGLRAPDGSLTRTGCLLEDTVDGRIELREGIRQATEYPAFVSGVLISPDIRRDKDMARAALNHDLARTVRGLDTLQEDLERIAEVVGFRWPPARDTRRTSGAG